MPDKHIEMWIERTAMIPLPQPTTPEEYRARNLKITRLVLKGYTMRNIGALYDITGARVNQIAIRECCRMLGVRKPEHIEPKLTMTYVRKNLKNRFITRIEDKLMEADADE